jgi:hypothetical protein
LRASRTFGRSDQLRKLLAYLCQAVIDSAPSDSLSEVAIGAAVFQRRDFDPQADTIVRVQMRRLRQKLDEYYAGEGRSDESRLVIDRHNYRPHLEPLQTPAEVQHDAKAVAPAAFNSRIFLAGFLSAATLATLIAAPFFLAARRPASYSGAAARPHPFWAKFLEDKSASIAVSAPLFFRTDRGYVRDFRLNLPDDLGFIDQYLGKGRALPVWDSWVGMGDLLSAVDLVAFAASQGRDWRITNARRITQSDLKGKKIILIGHPRGAPILFELLAGRNFHVPRSAGAELPGFQNASPQPGDLSNYAPGWTNEVERLTENRPDYALLSLFPGQDGGLALSIFGNRYKTEHALVRNLLNSAFLDDLARRILGSPGAPWPACQIVFKVTYLDGQPIEAAYVTHRIYR